MGTHLQTLLRRVLERWSVIGDIRGLGLMTAVDFVTDRNTRRADPALRNAVVDQAFHRGLLLLGCGESAIRFSPPLVISRAQVDRAIEIFEMAVDAATGG